MATIITNNFHNIISQKKLKISKISKDTGISRTTLTDLYYNRKTGITFSVIEKLCNYLNCNIDDIFITKNKGDVSNG